MAPLSRGQMPRKKSQSFADAFDDDCAKLSAKVDAQSESLHVMHVQRMNRDFKQLRTLNSEAVRLRSEIEQLTTDLQPRLERLAAKEAKQAVSAARMGLERVRDFGRADATKLEAAAAVKLQAKYRKKAAEPRHPLAHVHYCPESLRRNFLAGIRGDAPVETEERKVPIDAEAAPAAPVQPQRAASRPAFSAATSAPAAIPLSGYLEHTRTGQMGHFMSIL